MLPVLDCGRVPAQTAGLRVDDLEAVHRVDEPPGGESGEVGEHLSQITGSAGFMESTTSAEP
jgi:hypothetical protein